MPIFGFSSARGCRSPDRAFRLLCALLRSCGLHVPVLQGLPRREETHRHRLAASSERDPRSDRSTDGGRCAQRSLHVRLG